MRTNNKCKAFIIGSAHIFYALPIRVNIFKQRSALKNIYDRRQPLPFKSNPPTIIRVNIFKQRSALKNIYDRRQPPSLSIQHPPYHPSKYF